MARRSCHRVIMSLSHPPASIHQSWLPPRRPNWRTQRAGAPNV
jgi:hypothetical protein